MKKPREAKRMSDAVVQERTGKTWPEWFKILDKAGAKKMRHQDITGYLVKEHKVGPWWTQIMPSRTSTSAACATNFKNATANSPPPAAAPSAFR